MLTTAADYDVYSHRHSAAREPAGRRRDGAVRRHHAGGERARRAELHDEREGLRRRAHGVLARRRLHRDGAAGQRPDAAGRHQHRPRRARHLRRHAGRCPSCSARRASIRATSPRSGRRRSGASRRTRSRRSTCWSAPACGRSRPRPAAAWPPTDSRWPPTTSCRTPSSQQSLGRLPANALATGTTTVNLLNPGRALHARAHQPGGHALRQDPPLRRTGGPTSASTSTTCSTRTSRRRISRRTSSEPTARPG